MVDQNLPQSREKPSLSNPADPVLKRQKTAPLWLRTGRRVPFALPLFAFLAFVVLLETKVIAGLDRTMPPLYWRAWFPIGLGLMLFPMKTKWRLYTCAISWPILYGIFLVDAAFSDFFGGLPSLTASVGLRQLLDIRHSFFALLKPSDFLPFLLAAIFWVCGYARATASAETKRPPWGQRRRFRLAVLGLFVIWAVIPLRVPPQKPSVYEGKVQTVSQRGLYFYHYLDLNEFLKAKLRTKPLSAEVRNTIATTLAAKQAKNQTPSPFFAIGSGRNLVIIQLEAFQQFLIGLEIDGKEVTPFLNRLSRNHPSWRHCIDVTGVGRTAAAEFAAMTGLIPHPSGITPPRDVYHGLPAHLAGRGYATVSMHGFKPYFWNRATLHPLYGFQHMMFQDEFDYETLGWGVPDDAFFQQAANKLADLPSPYMAFLISLSTHHPFDAMPEDLAVTFGFPPDSMLEGYLRLAHFADQALAEFFAAMAKNGQLDRTIFAIYGDHDASLDAASRQLLDRAVDLDPGDPSQDLVPLMIAVPGADLPVGWRSLIAADAYVGLTDLYPSLLHLLGMDVPAGLYGNHLFLPKSDRDPMYLRHGIVTDGELYPFRDLEQWRSLAKFSRIEADFKAAKTMERAILDHGLQAKIAGGELANPNRTATVPAPPDTGHASLPAWQLTLAEPTTSDQNFLIAHIPRDNGDFLHSLLLKNNGETPQPYRLDFCTPDGSTALTIRGQIEANSRKTQPLNLLPQARDIDLGYAKLQTAAQATLSLTKGFQQINYPARDTFSNMTHIQGDLAGVHASALVLVNLETVRRTAKIVLSVNGEPKEKQETALNPGEKKVWSFDLADNNGVLDLEISGGNFAVFCLYWDEFVDRFQVARSVEED